MSWENYSDELKKASSDMNEKNDCTVLAWSNCFDAPYQHAHIWMKRHGRLGRRGMTRKQVESALNACKKARIRIGPYTRTNKITLSAFCKAHPVGRYYVCVRGHALCVKNGIVHDWLHSPRRQVQFAARVYLEGEY